MCSRFQSVRLDSDLRTFFQAQRRQPPAEEVIDRNTMSPVGNRQINKSTGEGVAQEEIIKGIQVDDGEYVVLTKKEIWTALPKSTQTVDIKTFVDEGSIPASFFQKPYHVAPGGRETKAYALLRDTLKKTGKVGVAHVVISTKQHLAAPRRPRPRRRHAPLLKRCHGAWLEVRGLCVVEYANVPAQEIGPLDRNRTCIWRLGGTRSIH